MDTVPLAIFVGPSAIADPVHAARLDDWLLRMHTVCVLCGDLSPRGASSLARVKLSPAFRVLLPELGHERAQIARALQEASAVVRARDVEAALKLPWPSMPHRVEFVLRRL